MSGLGLDAASLFYVAAIGLITIGITGLVLIRNLFRLVLALAIAEAGANLLLVLAGYRWDAVAPILTGDMSAMNMVDPVPQAMVLTAIVIGVGVQALALALVIRAKRAYGTLDMKALQARMEADIDAEAGAAPAASSHEPAGGRPLPAPGPQLLTRQGSES